MGSQVSGGLGYLSHTKSLKPRLKQKLTIQLHKTLWSDASSAGGQPGLVTKPRILGGAKAYIQENPEPSTGTQVSKGWQDTRVLQTKDGSGYGCTILPVVSVGP